ncbi:MAG: peptidoglycan-binding protein [Gammaproteobacteria bacterium]|nr:peptidoglycan-binding protein [Gammaproteobacteria bacterium]
MDGAKSAVNNYNDSDVDRFNAMVADYNSRCGSFRYRSGALESARRDIEPYRSQLQSEGRSRFARSPSTGSLSAPAPARPAPDATVQAIQRKLNELGYEAGTADGLMGRGTRSAILAFQQDRGLAATGVADQLLPGAQVRARSRTSPPNTIGRCSRPASTSGLRGPQACAESAAIERLRQRTSTPTALSVVPESWSAQASSCGRPWTARRPKLNACVFRRAARPLRPA